MDELRSRKVLDDQIINDAQTKAEQILQEAKDECKRISESVLQKVNEAVSEKEKSYSEKTKDFANDLKATVLLEKERFKVAYYHEQIINAVNEYLNELSEQKRLELIIKNVKAKCSVFNGGDVFATVIGMEKNPAEKELEKIFAKNLKECKLIPAEKFYVEDAVGLKINEGIILENSDSSVKCTVTLNEIVKNLLDVYAQELAESLFD